MKGLITVSSYPLYKVSSYPLYPLSTLQALAPKPVLLAQEALQHHVGLRLSGAGFLMLLPKKQVGFNLVFITFKGRGGGIEGFAFHLRVHKRVEAQKTKN